MLPVSLDCLRPVSCLPNVACVSGLSTFCVLFTQCCLCLWIVFVLCLVYPMLPVSLDCLRPVSCLPNVAFVFELSILDWPLVFSIVYIPIRLTKCILKMLKIKKNKQTKKTKKKPNKNIYLAVVPNLIKFYPLSCWFLCKILLKNEYYRIMPSH
jgi:hypothetical protein